MRMSAASYKARPSTTASAARRLGWHSAGCRWDKRQRCSPLAPPRSPPALGWPSPQQAAAGTLAAALTLFSARGHVRSGSDPSDVPHDGPPVCARLQTCTRILDPRRWAISVLLHITSAKGLAYDEVGLLVKWHWIARPGRRCMEALRHGDHLPAEYRTGSRIADSERGVGGPHKRRRPLVEPPPGMKSRQSIGRQDASTEYLPGHVNNMSS